MNKGGPSPQLPAPLPPPKPPPVQHPAPLPPPQPPPELGAGESDDENWTPYHLSTSTATALAPAATAQAASPPKQSPPNPPDDTAPAGTVTLAASDPATPPPRSFPFPFPNPTYIDGFPKREPGPMALPLPRAAGEYTEQEPSGALGHYFQHLGADDQPQHAGDWAHFANVLRERTSRTWRARSNKTLFLCTVTGPSSHLQSEKNTIRTPDPGSVMPYDVTPREVFHGFYRMICPGQSASVCASIGDQASHGTGFLRPWLFSTAEARTSK